MSRILIGSIGTRGDVYPMLAIGRGLVQRGHQVVFATSEANRPLVEATGLTFARLRPDSSISNASAARLGVPLKKLGAETTLRRIVFPGSEDTFHDLVAAGAGCDLLVLPMFLVPGQMAAERLGIPWVVTHAAPASFNSAYDPTRIPQAAWLYPLQRRSHWVPRAFKPIARRSIRSWWKPVRRLRRREGFPPLRRCPLLDGVESPFLSLALFSSALASAQKDWPQPTVITGFPFFDEPTTSEIETFVTTGAPPLVATLGSAVSVHRLRFLETTVEVARNLGKRLLLIAGPETSALRQRFHSAGNLLVVPYAPYSTVFPHACALIVAGSIGPVGHGMHAGKPMLIISEANFGPDQDDNAVRAGRLGISRWMPIARYTLDSAQRDLRLLLEQPEYAQNAVAIRARLHAEDGNARACDALEEFLQQTHTRIHGRNGLHEG